MGAISRPGLTAPATSRTRPIVQIGVLALAVLALLTSSASAVVPRASLADIQHQVMCVTCGIPLEEAISPQADRERASIQAMIDKGMTTAQIKHALVIALGPGVLALPPRSGFNLAVYIVPVVVIVLLLVILAVGLRRWRRRPPSDDGPRPPAAELGLLDATRLDEELVRFDS
jgi:cytochrome c-type biogenesis protein CcmH/NrfF